MKKFYSFITMAAIALSSQAAIQVTYNGQPLSNGQEINLDKDSFSQTTIIPGVLSIFKAEADLTVTGVTPIQLKAQSPSDIFQYCTGENCFSLSDLDGDGVYTGETTVNTSPESVQVDVNHSGATLPDNLKSNILFVLTDASGSSISFKVSVDSSAGVDNITTSDNYVRPGDNNLAYNVASPTKISVYTLAGNTVISTTVDGMGELNLDELQPGIYLYAAGMFNGKIQVK